MADWRDSKARWRANQAIAHRHWTASVRHTAVDQTDARWPDLVRWQFVGAVVGGFLGTLLGFGNISGFDLRSMALAVGGGLVVLLIYGLTR